MTTKLIIFDLDGTLIDSLEGLAFSMNQVLENNSFPTYSIEQYKDFVGSGIKNLVYKALPKDHKGDASVEKYYGQMLKSYDKHYAKGMDLYPGISQLLDRIADLGLVTAINTNKNQNVTESIVQEYLGRWDFMKVIGSQPTYERKPDPSAALAIAEEAKVETVDCLFIGDSEVDIQTAKNAGMKSIVVTWGFREKTYLLTQEPEIVVDEPEEILSML